MQCVILAGGLGTRIQSIAQGLPKALIPIHEKPFLHYQLSWLAKENVKNVVLSIGFGGQEIKDYAKDGRAWGLSIRYVEEGSDLKGTGGALRLAYDQGVLEPQFFVMYGDSFLHIDFSAVWHYFLTRKELALMTVYKNDGRWEKSNASFDGEKVLYNKKHPTSEMTYVDYGLEVLRDSVIEKEIAAGKVSDLADVLTRVAERHGLAGYEIKTRFYEIGSPQGLADFKKGRPWDTPL